MTDRVIRRSSRAGRRTQSAFTLIELLLVLAILTALAAIVVPRFAGSSEKAKLAACKAGLDSLKLALQTFEIDCGRFPTSEEGIAALVQPPAGVENYRVGGYLEKPIVPVDPWNRAYIYRCPGQHGIDYDLYSVGPDGNDGTEDDITNWAQPK